MNIIFEYYIWVFLSLSEERLENRRVERYRDIYIRLDGKFELSGNRRSGQDV